MDQKNLYYYLTLAGISTLFILISVLVFLSRGKPSLIKRKLAIGAILISLTGAVNSCYCGHKCYVIQDDQYRYKQTGWIDDLTYRVLAIGSSEKHYKNTFTRRANSKKAAILHAKYIIRNKFKQYIIEKSNSTISEKTASQIVKDNLESIISKGNVNQQLFNDIDECEILFEVKGKNLKQRLNSLAQMLKKGK